jgi:hypothetical protein
MQNKIFISLEKLPKRIIKDLQLNKFPSGKHDGYTYRRFTEYLDKNKESLIKYIKEENNYDWDGEIYANYDIFYLTHLLLTNFLKWCCEK